MLDIKEFRADFPNIRERLKTHNASTEILDEIIKLDTHWGMVDYQLGIMYQRFNRSNMDLARLIKAGADTTVLRNYINGRKIKMQEKEALYDKLVEDRSSKLEILENMLQGVDVEAGFSIDTLDDDSEQNVY